MIEKTTDLRYHEPMERSRATRLGGGCGSAGVGTRESARVAEPEEEEEGYGKASLRSVPHLPGHRDQDIPRIDGETSFSRGEEEK